MDYVIGFLFGYFIKETSNYLTKLSQADWEYRSVYNPKFVDLDFTEDDLP
jgi:hypothetical protein